MYAMYIRIEPNSANTNCPIIVFKYQCTFCELLTERPIYYFNNNAKIETKTSPVMLMVCIFLYVLHLFYRIDCHSSNRKHTLLRAACCHIISTIRLNSFISVRIQLPCYRFDLDKFDSYRFIAIQNGKNNMPIQAIYKQYLLDQIDAK